MVQIMKANIVKTSDYSYRDSININNIEDLLKIIVNNKSCIIIHDYKPNDADIVIEIYDGYRE